MYTVFPEVNLIKLFVTFMCVHRVLSFTGSVAFDVLACAQRMFSSAGPVYLRVHLSTEKVMMLHHNDVADAQECSSRQMLYTRMD